MIVPVCVTCATCRFFRRFTPETASGYEQHSPALLDDSDAEFANPMLSTEPDTDLLEYGKCVRNPPQFFSETLNGEWPIVHRSRVCGEYRPNASQN